MWRFLKTKWAREESLGAGTPPEVFDTMCKRFSGLPPDDPRSSPEVMPVACTGNQLWRYKPRKPYELRQYRGMFVADEEHKRAVLLAVYPRNEDTYTPSRLKGLLRRLQGQNSSGR